MNSYYSIFYYILFLPLVLIIYQLFPQKKRWFVLLIGSYCFFWSLSGILIIYLLLSTLSIHYTGLWLSSIDNDFHEFTADMEKAEKKKQKKIYQRKKTHVVAFAVIIHIGLILVLKYSQFFSTNINTLFCWLNIPVQIVVPKFAIPIGLSFYTLQAVSYIFDVYRGVIKADKNLGRLALYISFFPQIMEGPICRYSDTAQQLWEGKPITYNNLTLGIQRILLGMLKKFVVADRLNPLIKAVFKSYGSYDGGVIALAAVCYTIQLYMEFSGTMDIVNGTAEIVGVRMPENFERPFFSKTISEFWKRWHITLGTWFRDYVFYPLSMSKLSKRITSKARKKIGNYYGALLAGSIALFTVWFFNGLWHGVGWNYIFFGMYHFVLILCGNIFMPVAIKITDSLKINRNHGIYKLFQMIRTSILVVIGELFFRATDLTAGFAMFYNMVSNMTFASVTNRSVMKLGLDKEDFGIVAVTLIIILVVSILKEKGHHLRKDISGKILPIRWMFYFGLIMFIIIFGAYGPGYIPVDPMYADF